MDKEAKLFFLFDILGDIKRSGPIQWKIDRFRTSDIKDHIFDLIVIIKMLKPYLPAYINTEKMIDYAIIHDLTEVITGDITTFEGITKEEKKRVEKIAREYLIIEYQNMLNINTLLDDFEDSKDLEAKILHMIDKIHSSIEFLKYDNEKKVDMDNPEIIECLRENPRIVKLKKQGLSLGELFYVWHLSSVNFTEEEIMKYNISKEDADTITYFIKKFMKSIFKQSKKINNKEEDFPVEAIIYKNVNEEES